ncbi:hypothetical protein J40TS1_17860 [Paenibacillus montaniterrae]|uniref:Uncharacterized protein n=1 Tax=Paenibacillus montaniterrae TaxID=429341 RepID=A0A919YQ13_9BACL|nr:XRE family transcriptional regulator [Paenibacillus montaniterrae]GIP16144.1 hypothetical protein J40TS1_17860 [Paenibacillus montaniterrae]
MSKHERSESKTVLEYLVMINEQSYSGIGRQLHITPQQFSDWIKKRRPIPQERLQALVDYFGVKREVFVDSNSFVKPLTPIAKVELHVMLLEQKIAQLEAERADEEDIEPYREKIRQLLQEKETEQRLTRITAALQRYDERIDWIFDTILHEIENERVNELIVMLEKGGKAR